MYEKTQQLKTFCYVPLFFAKHSSVCCINSTLHLYCALHPTSASGGFKKTGPNCKSVTAVAKKTPSKNN